MAENCAMEGLADQVVDMHLVARDWWQENDGRPLPGEGSGYTVYGIEFWDGCRVFEYTQGDVFGCRQGRTRHGVLPLIHFGVCRTCGIPIRGI